MGMLNTLKLTAAQKPQQVSPVQQRRNKLLRRIDEQIELARAQQEGRHFAAVKVRTITDKETGIRRALESSKRVNAWWFKQDNGKLALSVRYGAKVLELAKGKFAVEVAADKDLVPTLELVRAATDSGELDTAIENAAGKLRDGFGK